MKKFSSKIVSHKHFRRLNKKHGLMCELVQQNHFKAVVTNDTIQCEGQNFKIFSVI